jgi:hypothetical protein
LDYEEQGEAENFEGVDQDDDDELVDKETIEKEAIYPKRNVSTGN